MTTNGKKQASLSFFTIYYFFQLILGLNIPGHVLDNIKFAHFCPSWLFLNKKSLYNESTYKFMVVINDVTCHFVFPLSRFQKQKHVFTAAATLDVNIYPSLYLSVENTANSSFLHESYMVVFTLCWFISFTEALCRNGKIVREALCYTVICFGYLSLFSDNIDTAACSNSSMIM